MENSNIEWCDATVNPWWGCSKVSPGCAHCYADTLSKRYGKDVWGKGKPREDHRKGATKLALKLERQAIREGRRIRVFCSSMADWLDDEVPIEWLADLLDLIRRTPNLDWLLLTKRPENFFPRLRAAWAAHTLPQDGLDFIRMWGMDGKPPANVWIGTSAEDQQRADERIPLLLSIPAKIRFLSCEPLLGEIDLIPMFEHRAEVHNDTGIHWIICGGESGKNARPMHPAWARSLRDQCDFAGIPFFFKQWGEWADFDHPYDVCEDPRYIRRKMDQVFLEGNAMNRIGKKAAGRLLDGQLHNAFP